MTAAELVERVARAIATRHSAFDATERDYWAVISECSKDHWCKRDYRILARAAIAETLAAIREILPARDLPMIDALAAEIREAK